MRLYIFGTSDDIEVTTGLRMLLEQKAVNEIILPMADENETHDQVLILAKERNIPIVQSAESDVLIGVVSKEDIVAFAWDDSDEVFEAVLDLQDRRVEMWDISDGLAIIDTETEMLEERLSEVLEDFVESLTAIVYKMVMDQVNGDGKWKYRRPNAN
jgi:hypothetical protein